jgi:acyl-CoA thioester hydrolase
VISYDDPKIYNHRFTVRAHELDPYRNVKPQVYLNYLEEAATQASDSWGYGYQWYFDHRRAWVARKHTLRYYAAITYPDEIRAYTWIADIRRVQSHRDYELRRADTDQRVLRGRTNWVYIDSQTFRPQAVPDEFQVAVVTDPDGLETLDTGIPEAVIIERPVTYVEQRRVSYHELDAAGIVNNSVYLAWADSTLANALRSVGWSPDKLATSDFSMSLLAYELEYFRAARDNDSLTVRVNLAEVGSDRAAWHIEIRNTEQDELLCKARTVRAFSDDNGTRSIPDALLLALTIGD